MKIIITEEQYRFLIESEDDPKLYNFTKLYKNDPDMWDEIFEQKNRLNIKNGGKKYDGYYIEGNVDLRKSKDITELKYLVKVGGDLDLRGAPITKLPMLSTVGGYLDLGDTQIKELPMLSEVGGDLDLSVTPIESLPMLSIVGSSLDLRYTPIKSLPMLSEVGGYLYLRYTQIESLPNLEFVGGYLNLTDTPLGKKLKKTMSEKEIKNKFGIKYELYI